MNVAGTIRDGKEAIIVLRDLQRTSEACFLTVAYRGSYIFEICCKRVSLSWPQKKKRKNEMRNWFQIFIIDLVQPPPSLPSPPLLRFAIPSISILKISLMKLANDLSLNGQSFFDENVTINISINHPYPSPSSYSMKGTNCYEASEKRNP